MKRFKFVIAGVHSSTYFSSFELCKVCGLRIYRHYLRKGRITTGDSLDFYSYENGVNYLIPVK